MNNCGWKTLCVFLPLFFILHSSFFILHSPTALALVGLDGLEPSTSRLSGARSNHLSYKPLLLCWFFPSYPCVSLNCWRDAFKQVWTLGGDDGIRTHDPLLAGQVLSQLSYTPIPRVSFLFKDRSGPWKLNNKRSVPSLLCTDLVLTRMTESWHSVPVSIERRWSSRTFRYGYLVTT